MADGRADAPSKHWPAFLLGVNYWPRRKAMDWWSDFDAAEVRDEFDVIADLGLHLVRLFLLWDDWQPSPSAVDEGALASLGGRAPLRTPGLRRAAGCEPPAPLITSLTAGACNLPVAIRTWEPVRSSDAPVRMTTTSAEARRRVWPAKAPMVR